MSIEQLQVAKRRQGIPTHQAAILTALNSSRQTFLGGVPVSGHLSAAPAMPIVPGATLEVAVQHLHWKAT